MQNCALFYSLKKIIKHVMDDDNLAVYLEILGKHKQTNNVAMCAKAVGHYQN